jgi:aminoacrylate hydrolase
MPKVHIDGADIHYEVHGSGPPVMLVAGLGGAGSYWQPQLAELGRHFTLIVHDHRGTGASTHQKMTYSVERMAADTLGVMDALGIDSAHLVGHSTGGAIGQILGIESPERLRSMIIYASWTKADEFFRRVFELRKATVLDHGPMAYMRATPVFLHPDWWINANAEKLAAAEAQGLATFPPREIVASRIDAIVAFDRTAQLGKIRTPTLVFCAADDRLTPLYFSQELAARIPGARLAVAEKGGHAHSQTMPEEFNRLAIAYIAEQEARRTSMGAKP